jgi:hypothetical protein
MPSRYRGYTYFGTYKIIAEIQYDRANFDGEALKLRLLKHTRLSRKRRITGKVPLQERQERKRGKDAEERRILKRGAG